MARGRLKVGDRFVTGPWREDQAEALEDRQRLVLRRDALPDRVLTFGDALAKVIADARDRGLPERTVRCHYEGHCRYLGTFWREDTRLVQITAAEVRWFVRESLDAGRSPNTLRQKDLPLLDQAFRVAGLASPVGQVREAMKASLKFRPPRMRFFEPADVLDLIRRMREEPVWHQVPCKACENLDAQAAAACPACDGWRTVDDRERPPIVIPARQSDADLVELLAATGARAGELGRVLIDDVDLGRRTIHVAKPKDRGNPRDLVVTNRIVPVVERLLARAEQLVADGVNPQRLLAPNSMAWLGNLGRRWQRRLRDRRINGRTLRHTFVTGLLVAGVSAHDARDLAGHKSLRTTDRYTHAVSGRRASAADRWDEHLAQLDQAQNGDAEAPKVDGSPT